MKKKLSAHPDIEMLKEAGETADYTNIYEWSAPTPLDGGVIETGTPDERTCADGFVGLSHSIRSPSWPVARWLETKQARLAILPGRVCFVSKTGKQF
jgi:hypothetical protein